MLKVFISQPMNRRTDEEIINTRERAINDILDRLGCEVEVLDNFFTDYPDGVDNCEKELKISSITINSAGTDETPLAPGYIPIKYLAKSIDLLAEANLVYFVDGYYKYRGCRIEYDIARMYGKVIMEEEKIFPRNLHGTGIDAETLGGMEL